MPLETATYISQLVPANPASDDALETAQNHLQLIKSVLQAQFPNLGAAAVTATAADLYAGIGTDVASIKTHAIIANPASAALQTIAGPVTVVGAVSATSVQQGGNPLVPSGLIAMWSGASTAIPAGWVLCNGASGTPDLRDRFIIGATLTYGVGSTGGATSATASTTTAGSHNHGGADGVAGPFSMTGASDTQGAHSHGGATGGHSLAVSELPSHSHTLQTSGASVAPGATAITVVGGGGGFLVDYTGSGNTHAHSIATDGAHSHNISVSNAPAHQHSISLDGTHAHSVSVATLPPFYALCFIMKT